MFEFDSLGFSVCPYSGLTVKKFDEWEDVVLTNDYSVSFYLIGGRIMYVRPSGYNGKYGMDVLINKRDKFISEFSLRKGKFAEIKDYTDVKRSSRYGRLRFTESLVRELNYDDFLGFWGVNASTVVRMIFNVGAGFKSTDKFPVKALKNYEPAILEACECFRKRNISLEYAKCGIDKVSIKKNSKEHLESDNSGFSLFSLEMLEKYKAELISYITSINWADKTHHSLTILKDVVSEDNPFKDIYESVSLLERDFTEAISEIECAHKENKELEKMLLNAEKLSSIGMVVSRVVHDYNNQISGLSGYISLIERASKGVDKIDTYVSKMRAIIDNSQNMTKSILLFARGSKDNVGLCDLSEVFNEVKLSVESYSDGNIKFIFPDKVDSTVIANKVTLVNVFLNFAVNAVDAMQPAGGTLTFETQETFVESKKVLRSGKLLSAGKYVVVSISDTGCGINKEDVLHIFEPFFTTKKSGSGMGLSTAYGVLNELSGAIDIETELGKGTTFYLYIPL